MAGQIARMDPDAVAMTKQSMTRTFEIMGLREALRPISTLPCRLKNLETSERKEFQEITRWDGLKAAIAWRDARLARARRQHRFGGGGGIRRGGDAYGGEGRSSESRRFERHGARSLPEPRRPHESLQSDRWR